MSYFPDYLSGGYITRLSSDSFSLSVSLSLCLSLSLSVSLSLSLLTILIEDISSPMI